MSIDENLDILLRRVCKIHTNKVNKILNELGMHKGQPLMLKELYEKDGVPQSVLAKKLDITPATAGTMVKRLEKIGYVKRKRDAKDERISNVYLTDEGRSISVRLSELQRMMDGMVFDGFSEDEKTIMGDYLTRILGNLAD